LKPPQPQPRLRLFSPCHSGWLPIAALADRCGQLSEMAQNQDSPSAEKLSLTIVLINLEYELFAFE
jgi:hypothetical protein